MRFCKKPGCPNLVSTGFCTDHEKKVVRPEKIADPFYVSVALRRFREWFISKYPLCVDCGKPGRIVHHKKSLKEHPELALDESNAETVCFQCHENRHVRSWRPRTPKGEKVYSYDNIKK